MSQIYSLIEYFGRQKVNSCGYCKTSKGHNDYGMWLHFLNVMDYQNLIDRGWRRSGSYGYKPVMKDACCALYTIRCNAVHLKLRRSQKKLIKRFNRFIVHNERRRLRNYDANDEDRASEETPRIAVKPIKFVKQIQKIEVEKSEASCSMSEPITQVQETSSSGYLALTGVDSNINNSKNQNKKKTIRFENAKKRIMAKGKTEEEATEILKSKRRIPSQKSIEDFLEECEKPSVKHKLEVKLVQSSPQNEEFEKTFELEYEIYRKYQITIHKDDPSGCTAKQFRRFLVTSPLQPQTVGATDAPILFFGSYHQQYWLDGKLIAVGVIDILPYCVSSVYFFYDPDYSDLVLGSYGSMKELQLARELHKFIPSVQYYYMGYYIHTCTKMRYKARISPSYLLCPETYTFHPINQCLQKISSYGVCRLHPDPEAKDDCYTEAIENVMVLWGHTATTYPLYHHRFQKNDEDEVREFVKVIGKKCADSLFLIRT